jgi:hypothetical protein
MDEVAKVDALKPPPAALGAPKAELPNEVGAPSGLAPKALTDCAPKANVGAAASAPNALGALLKAPYGAGAAPNVDAAGWPNAPKADMVDDAAAPNGDPPN